MYFKPHHKANLVTMRRGYFGLFSYIHSWVIWLKQSLLPYYSHVNLITFLSLEFFHLMNVEERVFRNVGLTTRRILRISSNVHLWSWFFSYLSTVIFASFAEYSNSEKHLLGRLCWVNLVSYPTKISVFIQSADF